MSAESTLYGILSGNAGVTALVGTRIYPDLVPENVATPYIGYERIGSSAYATIHGTKLSDDVQMMIACWADTKLAAEALADAVEAAMLAAGEIYTARGRELDDATNRSAATLDYTLLIQ